MASNLTPAVLRTEAWVNAWCSVLQKADRIMSGLRVTVSVADPASMNVEGTVPSWTDGLNVYIAENEARTLLSKGDAVSAALRLKGLNYHELCHVLFTPRVDSVVTKSVMQHAQSDPKWFYAFNALEDQRIETWFASMYGASRRYFEAIVMEWIIQNGTAEAAILLYGRKYLTPRIRVRVGKAFVSRYGQALYDEFKTVIDAYLVVTLPGEDGKALALIARFCDLLKQIETQNGTLPPLVIADNGGDGTHGHGSTAKTGGVSVRSAKAARNAAVIMVEDALDDDAEEEAGAGNGTGDQVGAAGTGNDPAGDESDDDGQDGPSGQSGQSTAQNGAGSGAGTGGSDEDQADAIEQMMDEAVDQLDDIQDDADVQADVEKMLDAVRAFANDDDTNLKYKGAQSHGDATPSNGARMAIRSTHGVLSRIRSAAESETLFRQGHGRLDARRYIGRQPGDGEIFRSYDSGREDEVGVEAVVLADVSGSMSRDMPALSEALWVLVKSFNRLDIRATVLLWDYANNTRIAYRPGEKAGPKVTQFHSGGGTDPTEALNQATRIFYKSSAPNKALITLTDGEWDGSALTEAPVVMRRMQQMGVTSLLLGLNHAVQRYGKHSHDFGHDMSSPADLPKAATKLVAGMMQRAENV